jgi:hypothetical protein
MLDANFGCDSNTSYVIIVIKAFAKMAKVED